MTLWIVTEAARLPASTMIVPTRAGSSTRTDQLEDNCPVHVELEQQLDEASVTFFKRAAAELFGCSNDESMCMFSSNRVDHSSRVIMTTFHVQTSYRGLAVSRSSSLAKSKARCSS